MSGNVGSNGSVGYIGQTADKIASVSAAMPQPGSAIPPAVTATTGAVGTTTTQYALSNHTHASSVQRKKLTVGANGLAVWTFSQAYAQVPVVSATAENPSGTQPITVDIVSVTTSGVTFKVWQASTLAITLAGVTAGLNLNPFASAAAGIVIDAIAAMPTS